jgi:hypothetical protein
VIAVAWHPVHYLWHGDLLTAEDIARLEGISVHTIRGFFTQCRGDVECVQQHLARRAERLAERQGCRYPYLDGTTKSLREIIELHPHLTRRMIERRLAAVTGPLDQEALAAIFADEPFDYHTTGCKQLDAEAGNLGPRRSLSEIAGPSGLERKYLK